MEAPDASTATLTIATIPVAPLLGGPGPPGRALRSLVELFGNPEEGPTSGGPIPKDARDSLS